MQSRTETFLSGGRPIRLTVAEPASASSAPAILLLHGAGGNTGFWLDRIAPAVTRLGIALFAVHYFDRTGTTRADASTLADPANSRLWLETLTDALHHIASRPAVNPQRIALVGISLGAFLSLALATKRPSPMPRCLVDISGGLIEPFAAQATSTFPPTLILHGAADTVVPATHATALDALLTRLHVPHRLELLPGEGHWFSVAAQPRLLTAVATFLAGHL